MRYNIEVVEAFCAYRVEGVCETGERVWTRGASLTESGRSDSSCFMPATK
jgi:hypothetical protein